jgi:Sec-independent protein translocase protein TatA
LSRKLGKSMSEFRRASEDFKRTWEREVNLDNIDKGFETGDGNSILDKATERIRTAREAAARDSDDPSELASDIAPSITPVDPSLVQPRSAVRQEPEPQESEPEPVSQPQAKRDWL